MIETMQRPNQNMPESQQAPEGALARTIEEQTARLPSDIWLWGALGSMGIALYLRLNNRKDESLFVGQWAAPLILVGVYNKLLKVVGSDCVK